MAIKDVAERTGLAAGTIRMWEQRYGFPEPQRSASGYRVYSDDDVAILRRVRGYRERGLSVPAALERARSSDTSTDRPSIYGAVLSSDTPIQAHVLRKSTLFAISRAIEDEAIARAAGPIVVGAFQFERNYRSVEHRYRRLAEQADVALVFADFDELRRPPGGPIEIPIAADDALGNEWAVVVDAPGYAACLLAWEQPESHRDLDRADGDRRFESMWTLDPRVVRQSCEVAAGLAGRVEPPLGAELHGLMAERPLAMEEPVPGLTALTNRILAYLEPAA